MMPAFTDKEVESYAKHRESVRSSIKKTVAESKAKDSSDKKDYSSIRDTEKPNKPIELEDAPKDIKGKKVHWGYHLLLDVGGCNKGVDDEKTVEDFLKQLVKDIKMKPLGDPIIVRVDSKKEGRGVSGVQIIESSTISFHGDMEGYAAYIDIFSCAPYDTKVAIDCVKKFFKPKHIGDLFVHRDASDWPKKKA